MVKLINLLEISSSEFRTKIKTLGNTEKGSELTSGGSLNPKLLEILSPFLDELKIFGETSFELMEDSQPAINAQKKNVSQSRFRHIKIKWHYIRQLLSEGWCKMVKINTKDQIADIATKILAVDTIRYFSKVVLGSIDQSLYAQDTGIPFNDWGVVSEPSYLSS